MQASVNQPATLSVLALADKTLVVSADQAAEVTVGLAFLPSSGLTLHVLDRRGGRVSPTPFTVGDKGAITWTAAAGREYELNWGGDSVHDIRKAEQQKADGGIGSAD